MGQQGNREATILRGVADWYQKLHQRPEFFFYLFIQQKGVLAYRKVYVQINEKQFKIHKAKYLFLMFSLILVKIRNPLRSLVSSELRFVFILIMSQSIPLISKLYLEFFHQKDAQYQPLLECLKRELRCFGYDLHSKPCRMTHIN